MLICIYLERLFGNKACVPKQNKVILKKERKTYLLSNSFQTKLSMLSKTLCPCNLRELNGRGHF